MALQPGFERYEGVAYFGRDINGGGVDAIVIVGQNTIEVRTEHDQVLSVWAPYSYYCNNENIPLRCYFSGSEWIAPKETELAEFLDKYCAKKEQPSDFQKPSQLDFRKIALGGFATLAVLAVGAYFTYTTSMNKLINENIAIKLDNMIFQSSIETLHACDQEAEPLLREYVLEKTPGQKYVVVNGLNSTFARLPSGLLAIEETWFQSMKSEDSLVALLSLATARNEADDPAKKLISLLSFSDRLNFLRSGEFSTESIANAWKELEVDVQVKATDIADIPAPIGDYQDLETIGALQGGEVALPVIKSGLQLGERDWQALTTMCRTAS